MAALRDKGGLISVPFYGTGGKMEKFHHYIQPPRIPRGERLKCALLRREPAMPGWIREAEREDAAEERQKERAAKMQAQGQTQGQVQLSPEQVRALIQAKKHQAQTETEAEEE